MSYNVEAVISPVTLGEAPHWDCCTRALYFVSIYDHTIHKYVPATGKHTRAKLGGMPTFIIPIKSKRDQFVVGLDRKLLVVEWNGEGDATVVKEVAEVDRENPGNRFNDAKADPRGRLFAGTMGHEDEPGKFQLKKGSLLVFDSAGKPTKVAHNIDISNGLCWDLKEKAFYYVDSFEYAIRRYNYDVETGKISNPKLIFKYADHSLPGIADGMTIDTDGNLWVANFDGRQVLNINPRSGELLRRIPIPALQVTSCAFGGRNLDELYVTTARMNRGEEQPPPSGSIFKVTGLGVRGHAGVKVRLQ